jgi:hypothetical protein
MDFNNQNDRLEFGQIILGHIQQILKLSRTLGSVEVYKGAVLVLSDALYSYYDDEMEKQYVAFENKRKKNGVNTQDYRMLFRNLLALVKRVDYFKSAIYGDTESDDEVVEDDDKEDIE